MSENIDELPESGWGIKIISQLADKLTYRRTPHGRNCLSIVKNYDRQELEQTQVLPNRSILELWSRFFSRLDGLKLRYQRQQNCETPLEQIHLKVNTDLNELERILQWFNQLKDRPIPQQVQWQCQLVLAEGFTNAVLHAHEGLPLETPIEFEVIVFNESLEIKIWDCGQPFDLEASLCALNR